MSDHHHRNKCTLLTFLQSRWVANLGKKEDAYKDDFVPQYYNVLGQYYNDRGGPYLLGDKVSYADFAVYQSIDNDARTGTLPVCLSMNFHTFSYSRLLLLLVHPPGVAPQVQRDLRTAAQYCQSPQKPKASILSPAFCL